MIDDAPDSEPFPESGPFCRHWGDPSDCDELCARCGHACAKHAHHDGEQLDPCSCCGCDDWKEPGGIEP